VADAKIVPRRGNLLLAVIYCGITRLEVETDADDVNKEVIIKEATERKEKWVRE